MHRKIVFLLFFFVGKIYAQSVVYPDSIITESLRISGLATNQKGIAVVLPNGRISNQTNFQLFIPAASFTPIDYTTAFHNTGEYCYFDIGTTYTGLIAPLILPDSVTITEVSFYMRVYGGSGQQTLTLNKVNFIAAGYWGSANLNPPTTTVITTLNGLLGPGEGSFAYLSSTLNEPVSYVNSFTQRRSYFFKMANSTGIWGSGMVFGNPPIIPNRFYGVLIKYKY